MKMIGTILRRLGLKPAPEPSEYERTGRLPPCAACGASDFRGHPTPDDRWVMSCYACKRAAPAGDTMEESEANWAESNAVQDAQPEVDDA